MDKKRAVRSIKIGKFFGIEVELHYSWFFIFILLAWALSSQFFPYYFPKFSKIENWIVGSISSLLLFVSVLLHELSHSLVAKSYRMGVHKITLFFFGGVAQIKGEHLTPKREFRMAIAGPAFSIILAFVFYFILTNISIIYVQAVCFYLFRLNLILAVFNLVPGFPLDGGRIFRSILWYFMKDIKRATKWAAGAGKFFAVFLVVIGVLAGWGGLWFILIGIFLYLTAEASYEQTIIKEILEGVPVGQVMKKDFKSVNENLTIAKLFTGYFMHYKQDVFLVTKNKKPAGIISVGCLKKVPKSIWGKIRVKSCMLPILRTADHKEDSYNLLIKMSEENVSMVPVIRNRKLIGLFDTDAISKFLRLRMELD
jgi:Zn-dependent protease